MKSRILMFFAIAFMGIAGCSDPCDDAVCLNGATCDDGDCICALGFSGTNCETAVDPCTQVTCDAGQVCQGGECYTLPVANFTITGNGCMASCSILFSNNSTDATSYSWNFGDGSNSTEANPTHEYQNGGSYTVTLTATNLYGSALANQSVLIQSENDPCEGVTCLNGGTCVNGSCNCDDGYTGPNCGSEVTPSSMRITKIVVTEFLNDGWDTFPASSPDIYVTLRTGSSCSGGSLLYTSNYYQDAYPGPNYDFVPSAPINISSPTSPIAICLYDDDVSGPEAMGGIYFNPYESGSDFPAMRTISAGDITYKVYFTYYW